jgi:diacylglycerol kinase
MNEQQRTNGIRKHLASYRYALNGIWLAFRYENNMRYHLLAAAGVLLINYLLQVSRTEWIITLMLVGMAWAAEIFNTAIEKLCDRVSREHDALIGKVKDLAAGAVLIICIIAGVCGLLIYLPYLLQ